MKTIPSPQQPILKMNLMVCLAWAGARQALFGLAAAAASLPFLFALAHGLGLTGPPPDSLLLLAGSVSLSFAGGGLLGTALATRYSGRRVRLLAALAGLVWGVGLCTAVLPLYIDSVVDNLSDSGMEVAVSKTASVLDHPSGALDQLGDMAGDLVHQGVTRLPALALLGWVVVGPVLAAPLEAYPRTKKRPYQTRQSEPVTNNTHPSM